MLIPVYIKRASQSEHGYIIIIDESRDTMSYERETLQAIEETEAKAIVDALRDSIPYSVFSKVQDIMSKLGKI